MSFSDFNGPDLCGDYWSRKSCKTLQDGEFPLGMVLIHREVLDKREFTSFML
ncbi:MAG: hypothetical protein LBI14_10950 [Treponema sp.]|jgi:hypothetical protein|nr:hypothetical protein [Treponema sp.]